MIRVTSGLYRGRFLQTPPGASTRPSQAKLRQALLNSIQASVADARVLDLFAGSGALGFEALSRGAASVVFVESAANALQVIRANAKLLGVESQVQCISRPLMGVSESLIPLGPFDLILADPPYTGGWEMKLLQELPWDQLLVPGGLFCLEWGVQKSQILEIPDRIAGLTKTREKTYGDSRLSHFLYE